MGTTVKKINRQNAKHGRTKNLKLDKSLPALSPGKRKSAKGKTYWETRQNRSDLYGGI
jgi:hypothetical protein